DTELEDGETYYAVSIVDECLSEPFAVTVNISLSINQFDQVEFNYFPNPTEDELTLIYEKKISEISLTNVSGQLILKQTVDAQEIRVDISSIPAGTYFLSVTADGHSKIIKVVKK